MKKTLSSILLIAFLLSLCNMAYAVDTTQIEMEQMETRIILCSFQRQNCFTRKYCRL